jgi:excinuclease UvrABC nuclease subunit
VLDLDCTLDFDSGRDEEFFRALPARPAVFLIELRQAGTEPLLGRSADLRKRLEQLLGPPDPRAKRLNLRELAQRLRYRETGSPFEQSIVTYQHAKRMFPRRYRDLLRLRPPALLKVNLKNAYPRCYVTRRIRTNEVAGAPANGACYGPFASRRAAEAFAKRFLDFFKTRRCQIKIWRDPAFPGCIYSEMKMCLAPCFAGCTKEDYDAEVVRLTRSLDTCGCSLTEEIEKEREQASEVLDFERAAALHKRLDKVNEVLRGLPEIVRRIEELDAVILQRAAQEQTVAVFALRGGWLAKPFFLRFAGLASQPRSAEEGLREQLAAASVEPQADLGEHLALVSRWYYSSPRKGEIFFRPLARGSTEQEWPYRRILRGCSRLLAFPATPEHKELASQEPAAPGEKQSGPHNVRSGFARKVLRCRSAGPQNAGDQ